MGNTRAGFMELVRNSWSLKHAEGEKGTPGRKNMGVGSAETNLQW